MLTVNDSTTLPFAEAKIKVRGGKIYACAGTPILDQLINWHDGGMIKETAPEGEWDLVVWDGKNWYSCDRHFAIIMSLPYAIGTGSDYALGALYCGVSTKKAVEIASQLDSCTGGKIQTMNYRKG